MGLISFLREHASGILLPWHSQLAAAEHFGLTCSEVEKIALENGLLPARYQRNMHSISCEQQLRLFCSRVAVVGCGGLGGYVIEELSRLGIGNIVAIDPDVFAEHNLNRQLLSSLYNIGKPKVDEAVQRIKTINPAVVVTPVQTAFSQENGHKLFQGADVVVDGLDSVMARLELAEVCTELEIPLVHGSIGGFFGQLVTQLPGDGTIQKIYHDRKEGKGVEEHLGNPAFMPAVVASMEVAEVCKIILGYGNLMRWHALIIDLMHMEFSEISD
ncbi:MAG: thiamine biosynthesis protein ThiF [Desulfuromonadaceae bacterium GWB2_53_15]|nr:MAG: thiamine biosynthesis protein ThiF [Desulfuromonadaceae bacterium GWB2_53_15]